MVIEGMIAGWLAEFATVKIAETLLGGVTSKLKTNDLGKALKIATKEAQNREEQLFFRCSPDLLPRFLEEFFKKDAREELQKPLNNQGMPDVDVLVVAFQKSIESHGKLRDKINKNCIKPWIEVFVRSYFEQTNNYLKFQVAKEDYFKQLINWFDDVKFAGIAVAGQETEKSEKLAEIFVMPDVVEDRQDSFYLRDLEGDGVGLEQSSGRKFNARHLLSQSQSNRVVLLGAPGSGKSTLMSYFAVTLASKNSEILGLTPDLDVLPILIRIRDLARRSQSAIIEYVKEFAEKSMAVKPLPVGFFEHWLEDGRALILLDGLDEVVEESKRYNVIQRMENFLGQYHHNRAIVTSRPAGYKRDLLRTEEFPHYQLQPFDDAKIEEFIDRWYDSRIQDSAEAKRRKDSLRNALNENDRVKLLSRNPLLLTIIVLIHRYQALLPKERYKLYDRAVETLLISWDANREITSSDRSSLIYLKLDDLQRLMESLAYWVHTRGSSEEQEGGTLVDRDELIEQLAKDIKILKQVKLYEAREEAKRFVTFIRDRTGLLNEQGQDCYAFVHKTFQEYLCAQEINYQADNEGDFDIVLDCIREHIHDGHWREVLLLLIAQQKPKKAAKAIRAILDCSSEYEQWLHRDLLFAGDCLAEEPKDLRVFDNGLSQDILEKLVDLEASKPEKIGERVRDRVSQILCSFQETEFESKTLQLLKDRAGKIKQTRLLQYRIALGE
ncbi:MAG: NACHT domain-containing NTPase, partial [Spirulina sp.]